MKRKLIERELTAEGPVHRATTQSTARGKRRSVTVNVRESPTAWLHARGHLTAEQFAAAEALRADYERAGLAASITMRWDPVRSAHSRGDGNAPSERQLIAKERFNGAMLQAGKGLEDVLWRVVCAGDSLSATEKTLFWPARSGKLVLGFALDRVAEFYQIGSRGNRRWNS